MTFHGAIEMALTKLVFRQDGTQGRRFGLPAPVFWWEHRALKPDAAVTAEADYALLLSHHFVNIDVTHAVRFVVASDTVHAAITDRLALLSRAGHRHVPVSHFLRLEEATKAAMHDTHVVVFCMGGFADPALANRLRGEHVTAALTSATHALVVIGHALWPAHSTPQHPVSQGYGKIAELEWKAVAETADTDNQHHEHEAGPMVGATLPLCCPRHPGEIFFANHDDAKVPATSVKFCRRLCLQPFTCHRAEHVCLQPCHLSDGDHSKCRYACEARLACGHVCRARCGEACDCFERATCALACNHMLTVGEEETAGGADEKPQRRVVQRPVKHAFDGPCIRRSEPCEVPVPIQCRHCSGSMSVPCHSYHDAIAQFKQDEEEKKQQQQQGEANSEEANHDAATKDDDGKPAAVDATAAALEYLAVCDECLHARRQIEHEQRVALLKEADAKRAQLRREVEGQLHEQRKAATTGMFSEGQRVAIRDVAGVRGELDYLFPDVASMPPGNRWCHAAIEDLLGDHGRVAARHVDLTDTNEVLYLIALARGGHTVVADTGLELLRAVIHSSGADAPVSTATNMLLITGGPSSASAYVATDKKTGDDGKPPSAEEVDAALRSKFPIGSFAHCVAPVKRLSPDGDAADAVQGADATAADDEAALAAAMETNVCGEVVKVDNGIVTLRCVRRRHEVAAADDADNGDAAGPAAKAHRTEGGEESNAAPATRTTGPVAVTTTTEEFLVEARENDLDPLLQPGEAAVAREPPRHVHALEERRYFAPLPAGLDVFLPVPLPPDEAVTIHAVLNYPFIGPGVSATYGKSRGPCYIVAPRRDRAAHTRVAIVPVVFVEVDTELRAEKELTRGLQQRLRDRVAAAFTEHAEQRLVRNVETQAKKAALALRVFKRSVAANGGTPPEKTETWGGGAAAVRKAPAPGSGGAPLDRSVVSSARSRDSVMEQQTPRRLGELAARARELAAVSKRQADELRAALGQKVAK